MVNSMTAFAMEAGTVNGTHWTWEIRSVNGRGLDVRTRLPDGCESLESVLKAEIGARCKRGNVNVVLKLKREALSGQPTLNIDALDAAVRAAKQVLAGARAEGLDTAPIQVSDLLGLNGVFEIRGNGDQIDQDCLDQVKTAVAPLVGALAEARADEGVALQRIIGDQIDRIEALHRAASDILEARQAHTEKTLRTNIDKLLQVAKGQDEARIAQELALLAVKSDVTEELDRLGAHITAARELLAAKGAIGRKFDFLTQEFNREANTLCSKSNFTDLTRIGLDLKTVIDQMREQVQNVE